MQLWELLMIAIGLSMDAFAVAICKGLSVRKVALGHALTAGLYFGAFQALMPLLGYFLGTQFESLIQSVDHWIAFALLSLIGINMIRESRREAEPENADFGPRAMLPLAVGKGRCAATEILVGTDAVANLIREGKCYQIPSILQSGAALGMHSLNADLARLVSTGRITREAAERCATNKSDLKNYL